MTKETIFVLALMIGIISGLGLASTLLRAHAYSEEINKAIEDGRRIGLEAAEIVNGEIKNVSMCNGGVVDNK